jgi:hypothetical protein
MLTALLAASWSATQAGAEPPAAIHVRLLPQTVFADSKITVELELAELPEQAARVVWSLETLQHRTLARNEISFAKAGAPTKVTLTFPPLNDGVIMPLRFQAAIAGSAAGVDRKVWVFPRSPWSGHRTQLERAKITLFDPDETIGKCLTEGEVPFETAGNVAALSELRASLILIGEGVDFREYPDLASVLWKAAAVGNLVVCLSPTNGTLPFGEEPADVAPSSFSLRRRDILADLDPRLDAGLWNGKDTLPVRYLAPRGDANVPSLEVTDDAGAWPWVEARFASTSGRLIVCGLGLGDGWESSPTPRYLLLQLLTLNPSARPHSTASER